jgi:predicted nucleotidyltransferase
MTAKTAVPEVLQEDINRAVEILKEGGCTEIYLFGSGATGKVRNESDIDLAVRGCPQRHFSTCWAGYSGNWITPLI